MFSTASAYCSEEPKTERSAEGATSPELSTGEQSPRCLADGTLSDARQGAIEFFGCLDALPAHMQLAVDYCSLRLFSTEQVANHSAPNL